jgi:lysophospholipase L1-like esterase
MNNIKRVMIFGDSNALGPGAGKKSWPKLVEEKDPNELNVINESFDGRTISCNIGECNGLSVVGKKLDAHKPIDYVIVALGTNDVKDKYGPPSPVEIAVGMLRILEIIDNHGDGAKIILLTPPPMGDVVAGDLSGAQLRIPPVATEFRLLAMSRDIRLVDINSILEISTDLEPDMIHLNSSGRKKVAAAVWKSLN